MSRPKGMSSRQQYPDLGNSYKAAWHLAHCIREAYRTDAEPCERSAEADEIHVGGLERNKLREEAACRVWHGWHDLDGRT